MQAFLWHSKLPGTKDYHNNLSCRKGRSIDTENRGEGAVSRRLCKYCKKSKKAMQVSPWYSKLPGTKVYHDNISCAAGNNIELENRGEGTDNRRLCKHCNKAMKVPPWHSKLSSTKVYHDNILCTEGNNIEFENWAEGAGGLRLCKRCKRLDNRDVK